MDSETWDSLTRLEKENMTDYSDLSPQLKELVGFRVEVETLDGETRRFIVGKSTGWKPIHLEVKTRRSLGGMAAEKLYKSVKKIGKVR